MAKPKEGKKVKQHKLLEKVGAEPQDGNFSRALGSTDFHTRERGLQALTLWLSRRAEVSEHDLLRLWKALFYCFWHSDKSPVQASLGAACGAGRHV
jgi:ribosomal RNA-processing protein 1